MYKSTIVTIIIAWCVIGIVGLVSCDRSYVEQTRAQTAAQYQKFTTLNVGDEFVLEDYNLIEPSISYRNEYTTTYRIRYNLFWWHTTVYNDTHLVKAIRSFK